MSHPFTNSLIHKRYPSFRMWVCYASNSSSGIRKRAHGWGLRMKWRKGNVRGTKILLRTLSLSRTTSQLLIQSSLHLSFPSNLPPKGAPRRRETLAIYKWPQPPSPVFLTGCLHNVRQTRDFDPDPVGSGVFAWIRIQIRFSNFSVLFFCSGIQGLDLMRIQRNLKTWFG